MSQSNQNRPKKFLRFLLFLATETYFFAPKIVPFQALPGYLCMREWKWTGIFRALPFSLSILTPPMVYIPQFETSGQWAMGPLEIAFSMYVVSPRHEHKHKDNRLFSNLLVLC